jgi:hypothetical protein
MPAHNLVEGDRQMRRLFLLWVVCGTLLMAGIAAGMNLAFTPVVPPNSTWYGASYGEWSGRWLKWLVTPPKATNPLVHTKNCMITPQPAKHVWFLTASTGGKLSQSCKIPSGRAIFVTIAGNTGYSETAKDTFPALRKFTHMVFDQAKVLEASIDGQPVPGLRSYRSGTRNLVFSLPNDNILELPPGPTRFVAEGYSLLVTGLTPGKHTIVVYQETVSPGQPTFKAGMTYNITIG